MAEKTTTKKVAKAKGTKAASKEEGIVKLRIRVRAYENKILDTSVKQIMDTALRHSAFSTSISFPSFLEIYHELHRSCVDLNE
jgi:ribosomal protein S10